ncbi:cobyrinate a,c-diamide synthase [Dactylosporangium salmoneum]|uniref:Cobyrinic acid a,c-diamide synthase n=1 Tax=Dactylosporangium salmoneum TaxID=53361 RepID=A0ABN3GNU4_9ACTN
MSTIPRLVISAPSSGHGKTAISVGLLAALSARGYRAAGFKIGPDHVDAAYLGLAAGRPGRNLDPRMVGAKRMGPLFAHGAASLDIAVVEGTMGLFDGLAGRTDSESTAQISGLLRAPVILVVDVGAMGQSVAALVHGFRAYDELLWLGGVILNRVASSRHEQLLREALDDIGVPVLGALRRHALSDAGESGAPLPSRQHGVAPVVHHNIDAVRAVRRLGEVIAAAVDIDRTMALARSAPRLTSDAWDAEAEIAAAGDPGMSTLAATRIGRRPIIGVSFAYPETAELLAAAGAEVVPFDPLRDETLPPNVDGLVIGAALPESYAEELTFNGRLRSAVAAHAAAGKPIAAEGTGLVWLCRDYNGRPMCGVVDASARETDLVVLGYREATARSSSVLLPVGAQVIGHKMHRTSITPRAGLQAAWTWAGGPAEGFVQRGVHASYLGLHWAGTPSIAARFVAAAGATAAPTPGQWSTPSTSPYGRPSVPIMTFPTAPVTGVAAAAGTPSYTADYTAADAPAPRVQGAAIPGSILASPGGPGSIASGAADGTPSPTLSLPPVAASAVGTSSVPASPYARPVEDAGKPANAPTSPGASSPFGPALGAAMPTPWTADSASAGASSAASGAGSAASGAGSAASGATDSQAPAAGDGGGVPAAGTPDAEASVPGPSAAGSSGSAPSAAAAVASGGQASSAVGDSGDSDLSYVSDSGDERPRSGGGLPAAGLVIAGPWAGHESGQGGSDDDAVDQATTVLPGDTGGAAGATPPGATGGASVGVPSDPNGPADAAGLPSSGVVPTSVPIAPGSVPGQSTSQSVSAAQPVSTPPVSDERPGGAVNPATSSAVPVSSAPMPRATAPVSAAPIGVTAMSAVESELAASEAEAGSYAGDSYAAADSYPADSYAADSYPADSYSAPSLPISMPAAGLAEQAPVSAPPVSAPPSSNLPSPGGAGSSSPVSTAPVSSAPAPGGGAGSVVASAPVTSGPVFAGSGAAGSVSGVPVSSAPVTGGSPFGPAVGTASIPVSPVSGAGSEGSGSVVSGSVPSSRVSGSSSDLSEPRAASTPPGQRAGDAAAAAGASSAGEGAGSAPPAGGSSEAV